MIDALPEGARRALALQAALGTMGFSVDSQIFIGTLTLCNEAPAPPGSSHLAVILAIDGDPMVPSFIAFAGCVERAWWNGDGRMETVRAWNALADHERYAMRLRFVSLIDVYRMAQTLIERGIVPPAMADIIPHGRN